MIHFSRKPQREIQLVNKCRAGSSKREMERWLQKIRRLIKKGVAGPSRREVKKELRVVHKAIIKKVKKNRKINPYFEIKPTLSKIAVKYAIMSVGGLPKKIKNKVADLVVKRVEILASKTTNEFSEMSGIEMQLEELIKDPETIRILLFNYDIFLTKLTGLGIQIFRDLTKEQERTGK